MSVIGRGVPRIYLSLYDSETGGSSKAWEPILIYISLKNMKSLNDLIGILGPRRPNEESPKMSP